MHKIHHSYTASAFGILEKVSPKGASEYNCVGPEWGGDELRSSRSAVVPSTTPFACHHNPLLETFLSILSQEGVMRRENEENPATPLRCFLPQNVVACGLGPSICFLLNLYTLIWEILFHILL